MTNHSDFQVYRAFVDSQNRLPKNIAELQLNSTSYSDLNALVADLWKSYADTTLELCATDPAFESYTAREKLLAYTFTLIQTIKDDKASIVLQLKKTPNFLKSRMYKGFKDSFLDFATILCEEGIQTGEIQNRPFIADYYPNAFWGAIVSVLIFWIRDDSEFAEQTDVAVEKIIHLAFDSVAPNAIDSATDLVQFLIKQRFNG